MSSQSRASLHSGHPTTALAPRSSFMRIILFASMVVMVACGEVLPTAAAPKHHETHPGSIVVPGSGTWQEYSDAPESYWDAAGAVHGEHLYVSGGMFSPLVMRRWNPATDVWEELAPIPIPMTQHVMVRLGAYLYAVTTGGETWRYAPGTNSWRQRAADPNPGYESALVQAGGYLYLIGGYGTNQALSNLRRYDPATDSWTLLAALPERLYLLAAAAIGGKIYVTGGYDEVASTQNWATYVYDIASDGWTGGAPIPADGSVYSPISVAIDGIWYVMGGQSANAFAYDPAVDSWTAIANGGFANRRPAVGVFGKTVFAVGGFGSFSIVRSFTPANAGNHDPVASFTVSAERFPEGAQIGLDASASSDIDGDDLTFSWDFGDGTMGNGATVNHTYSDDGDYRVTLTVSDGQGGKKLARKLLRVRNVAPGLPTFGNSVDTLIAGENFVARMSISDVGTNAWTATWRIGDGAEMPATVEEDTVIVDLALGVGYYVVNITVTDDDGATGTSRRRVRVLKRPAVADLLRDRLFNAYLAEGLMLPADTTVAMDALQKLRNRLVRLEIGQAVGWLDAFTAAIDSLHDTGKLSDPSWGEMKYWASRLGATLVE